MAFDARSVPARGATAGPARDRPRRDGVRGRRASGRGPPHSVRETEGASASTKKHQQRVREPELRRLQGSGAGSDVSSCDDLGQGKGVPSHGGKHKELTEITRSDRGVVPLTFAPEFDADGRTAASRPQQCGATSDVAAREQV